VSLNKAPISSGYKLPSEKGGRHVPKHGHWHGKNNYGISVNNTVSSCKQALNNNTREKHTLCLKQGSKVATDAVTKLTNLSVSMQFKHSQSKPKFTCMASNSKKPLKHGLRIGE